MNRVLLWPTIVLLLLGVSTFWISRGEDVQSRHDIVICNMDNIKTLDPGQMSWANDIRIAMGLWEGLVAYDPVTLAPIPGVAEKWELSPDGKTYTFHLRAGAKWSNGDPVTSADFVFAWKRVLQPVTAADYVNLFFYIRGAKDYFETLGKPDGKTPADFANVGIKTPDAQTVVIELENPCSYYLDLVAFPCYYPLHEKSMDPFRDPQSQGAYKSTWTHPPALVTNGPFRLAEWKFQRYVRLTPNENYWDRAAVKAPGILVTSNADGRGALLSLQNGDVDVVTYLPQDFGPELIAEQVAGKRHDVHYSPVFGSYYYVFNCQKPPFTDRRVRKALSLVIDRDRIVNEATRLHQKPLTVIVPPDSILGYKSPEGLANNIEEARKLLADAGYPDGKGLPPLEIFFNNDSSVHKNIAQVIGQMWLKNLGVTVTYRSVERPQFGTDRKQGNFTIARGGWYGDYADPTTWLDLLNSNDGNNDGKFSSKEYDALQAKAGAEADPAKRFALLKDAEKILVTEEFPLIPLYQYSDGYMFDENKIGGLTMNVRLLTQFKYLFRK